MSQHLPLVSVNGVLGAALSPLDRGFAYGDGLFETLRVQSGRLPLWPLHLQRLRDGAGRLGIPLVESNLVRYRDHLLEEADRLGVIDGTLKVVLTRGEGGRGYAVPARVEPTLCLFFHPAPPNADDCARNGVRVRICTQRLSASPLAGLKHLNRLEQVLARAEWQDDKIAEGLLLDQSGLVIEATASNIFAVIDGNLVTPDLCSAGVAGVMRRLIIERLAPELGLSVLVASLSLKQLQLAEEVFLCNSVRGIWPVTELGLDKPRVLEPGAVTRSLQGEVGRVLEWGLN